ncbi:hypothetical protein LTR67_004793 [Exophiala xenobiotica]
MNAVRRQQAPHLICDHGIIFRPKGAPKLGSPGSRGSYLGTFTVAHSLRCFNGRDSAPFHLGLGLLVLIIVGKISQRHRGRASYISESLNMHAATSYSQTDLDFRQPTTEAPEQVPHIVDREQFGVYTARGSNVSQKPKNDHFGRQIGPSHLPERPLLRLPGRLVRRVHDVLRRRNKNDPHTSNQACADPAPLLAPSPLSRNANDRLGPELQEKPRVPPIREFIHSPLLAVKEVIANEGGEDFAQNVGKAEVSHGANVALVIENARVRQSNEEDGASCDEDVLDGLKQSRQDSFTRWTMDRHVRNVGRIQAHVIPLRARKEFLQRNAQGRERIDWIGYGQYVSPRNIHPVTEVADIHTVVAVHRRKLFTSND